MPKSVRRDEKSRGLFPLDSAARADWIISHFVSSLRVMASSFAAVAFEASIPQRV